jgi:zinc protease
MAGPRDFGHIERMSVMLRAAMLLAAASAAIGAQTRPGTTVPKATFVTTVEGVSEYRLPNGLRVVFVQDSSRPSVTVNAVYFVGSRDEGYGEAGMAHLLEHLLFRGTRRHPDMKVEETRLGARRNGGTGVDQTNYVYSVPAVDSAVDWVLDLQADRMVNALVTQKDLAVEYSVVRNELELGESSSWDASLIKLMTSAFQWHAYRRPVLGTVSDIENVPIDRLQAFYKRHYQPDNAALIVTGRFSIATLLPRVERTFGTIPRPRRSAASGNLLVRDYTVEPPQQGDQFVTLRRASDDQLLLYGWHVPGVAHPDYSTAEVLADVIASNPSGRLYKALVDTREASAVTGDVLSSQDPNLLFVRVRLRLDQSLDSVNARVLRLVDSARSSPFSAEEVTRAKTSLLRNLELMMSNPEQFAISLGDWIGAGDWRLLLLHRDRIAATTPEDVRRVAATYLKPTNRTTVAFIATPNVDRTVVPASPAISELVSGYKGNPALQPGENFEATPANIEARARRLTLPSGMRLTLVPKRTRGTKVSAQLILRFGSESSLENKAQVSSLTSGMLMRGTTNLTRQQLIDSLSRLRAAVSVSSSTNSATVTIEAMRENFVPVLDLVGEVLRSPRFDAEELESYKKERLVQLDIQKSDPPQQAINLINSRYAPKPPGHVLHYYSTQEQIQGITAATIDDVRSFHRANFGASASDFAAVGDLDVQAVTSAARRLFGDWKNPQPFARPGRVYQPTDSAFISLEIPDKTNSVLAVGTTMELRDDDPDYPAMALVNYMLASGPSAMLVKRTRDKEGLSYAFIPFFTVQPLDRYATWTFGAMAAPKNIERLQFALRDELDRIVRDGFTDEELQRYRAGFLQSREQARGNEPALASLLAARSYAGRTLAFEQAIDDRLAALTLAEINEALRKYIDPKRLVMVRVGDFLNNPPPKPTP